MSDPETRRTPGILRRILGHWGLLATIVICVGAFLVIHVSRCRDEQSALSRLRKSDDGREYRLTYWNPFKTGDRDLPESVFRGGPEWITDVLGVDPFKTTSTFSCVTLGNAFSYSSTVDGGLLIDATYRSGVDDQQAELICQLSNLRSLALAANPITDSGVRGIASLSRLENLDLANTRITDEALKVIAKLPRLQNLTIPYTHVSDEGIAMLSETPTLEVLDVFMTRVTSEGVRDLKKRLPNCWVRHENLAALNLQMTPPLPTMTDEPAIFE